MRMLLVAQEEFHGRSLFGARTVDLKKLKAPTHTRQNLVDYSALR